MESLAHSRRRGVVLSVWIATVVAMAGACSGPVDAPAGDEPEAYGRLAQPIKGGMVDKTTNAIVGIWNEHPDGNRGLCSGTLIAPNLVLTARHCVNSVNASPGTPCSQIEFGEPNKSYRVTTNTRMHGQAKYYHDAEVYRPSGDAFCGRDIAMIRLENSIPASEAKPIAPRLKSAIQVGQSYAAVGFGRDGSDGNSGVRRRLDNRSVQCKGISCGPSRITAKEFIGDGPACHGDSGTGGIAPDRTVFGVTSRAGKDCKWTMFTSAYDWRSFIQKYAADAARDGGYSPPVWTNTGPDADGDGYADGWDNCPQAANESQSDADGDEIGDACDEDIDGDGRDNDVDLCPEIAAEMHDDTDGDGLGDACDDDKDSDGIKNAVDNCPATPNPEQVISDGDGTGDACDDSDGDGVVDADDNCPEVPNETQSDGDSDGRGDACDVSSDVDAGRADVGSPDTGRTDADTGTDISPGSHDAGGERDTNRRGERSAVVVARRNGGGCSILPAGSGGSAPWARTVLFLTVFGFAYRRRRSA